MSVGVFGRVDSYYFCKDNMKSLNRVVRLGVVDIRECEFNAMHTVRISF